MHASAQSMHRGQQLIGLPSLMQTDTQFSQAAAQAIKTSILSVYFLLMVGIFHALMQ
jgi:hypothetical protein